MKILNGIDIASVDRIAKTYQQFGDKFLNRVFTEGELISSKKTNNEYNINYLAKRFSAKEAFSKAIGEGIGNISFKDISITNNSNGSPKLTLSDDAVSYLLNAKNWVEYDISVSLSDDNGMVIASVVILLLQTK